MIQIGEPVQLGFPKSGLEDALHRVTCGDLDFKGSRTAYATHNTHAFAAKFPPQLPAAFIQALTVPGEVVLDPMAGSGTALVEAALAGRRALGSDLDPLAVRIAQAKTCSVNTEELLAVAEAVADYARIRVAHTPVLDDVLSRYEARTREFIEYWFLPDTIRELHALVQGIKQLTSKQLRPLLQVIISSVIVTKSGGVSLARDLAHSRPHKVSDKIIRNAIDVFYEKALRVRSALDALCKAPGEAAVIRADARALPLVNDSVDLIVTSPPYASAIDYVRAHKFSLVWFGYQIPKLSSARRRYIGAELGVDGADLSFAPTAQSCTAAITGRDRSRARAIARYFLDMKGVITEMRRVLKPHKACIIVVGSSTVRGVNIATEYALAETADYLGFKVVAVQERQIDRDRRLMPISYDSSRSGIEARIHREHVIALVKR